MSACLFKGCKEDARHYIGGGQWACFRHWMHALGLVRPAIEQASNRNDNRLVTYNGETKTLAAWARLLGVGYTTLRNRLDKWGDVDLAFTYPPKNHVDWRARCIDIEAKADALADVVERKNCCDGADARQTKEAKDALAAYRLARGAR